MHAFARLPAFLHTQRFCASARACLHAAARSSRLCLSALLRGFWRDASVHLVCFCGLPLRACLRASARPHVSVRLRALPCISKRFCARFVCLCAPASAQTCAFRRALLRAFAAFVRSAHVCACLYASFLLRACASFHASARALVRASASCVLHACVLLRVRSHAHLAPRRSHAPLCASARLCALLHASLWLHAMKCATACLRALLRISMCLRTAPCACARLCAPTPVDVCVILRVLGSQPTLEC